MMSGRTRRHRSRAVLVALAVASGIALLPASPAAAHVHGITPLRCVGTANDGANHGGQRRTDLEPDPTGRRQRAADGWRWRVRYPGLPGEPVAADRTTTRWEPSGEGLGWAVAAAEPTRTPRPGSAVVAVELPIQDCSWRREGRAGWVGVPAA